MVPLRTLKGELSRPRKLRLGAHFPCHKGGLDSGASKSGNEDWLALRKAPFRSFVLALDFARSKYLGTLGASLRTRPHLAARMHSLWRRPESFTQGDSGVCFPSKALWKARRWGVKGGRGAGTAGDNYLQSKDLQESHRPAGWGVLPGWIIEVIWAEATGLKYW